MQEIGKSAVTTPAAPRSHGFRPLRGLQNVSSSEGVTGRFGRMFRNLPIFEQHEDDLVKLAGSMIQDVEEPIDKELGTEDEDENTQIPAGYTYLGQFLDHDISFDPVSSLQRQSDPDALIDFRTPRFDLDSIYGRGPADQPYLYEDGLHFALGNPVSDKPEFAGPDLPRNSGGRAIIGDPRNDENLIVSQLHCLFLRFHNKMVDVVKKEWTDAGRQPSDDDIFKETQRRVRWHYQWIVIHDYLPRIIGGALKSGQGAQIVSDMLNYESFKTGIDGPSGPLTVGTFRPRLLFYNLDCPPFIPIEFAVAAYRFGHSMVRPSYFFNDFVKEQIAKTKGEKDPFRTLIFSKNRDPANLDNLNGFRPLPGEWGFQWKFFFEVPERGEGMPQPSYKIDATLVNPLSLLPDKVADNDPPFSLAERNLLRGHVLGLPSGEYVARAMGVEPLSPEKLAITQPSLISNTPLWYYVLKEAEVLCESHHLGPVGARIVAETFIGLLWGDPLSFLRVEPTWKPDLANKDGVFGMPELITFTDGAVDAGGAG
jgi:Animal haem peroxidase